MFNFSKRSECFGCSTPAPPGGGPAFAVVSVSAHVEACRAAGVEQALRDLAVSEDESEDAAAARADSLLEGFFGGGEADTSDEGSVNAGLADFELSVAAEMPHGAVAADVAAAAAAPAAAAAAVAVVEADSS